MKEDIDDIDEDIEDTEMDLETLEAKIMAGSIFFCLKAVIWRIEEKSIPPDGSKISGLYDSVENLRAELSKNQSKLIF